MLFKQILKKVFRLKREVAGKLVLGNALTITLTSFGIPILGKKRVLLGAFPVFSGGGQKSNPPDCLI